MDATYDIHIRKTLTTKMTVMPSSGEVVFFSDFQKSRQRILVFRNGRYYKSIGAPCNHIQGVNLLGMKIWGRKEYLAGSCAACGTIKLMDFENSETSQK